MKKFGNYLRNPHGKRRKKRRARGARRNPFALTAVNPARKKRRKARRVMRRKARRKNPLVLRHILEDVPSRRNPHRKKRRKKNSRSNRNPPMSKKRKRRSRRSRNPVSHTRRRRSRNPRRRSHSRRRRRNGIGRSRRNPVAIVRDVITRENVETGLGVFIGIFGSRWTINTLIQGDPATGARMFDLPGVTYSTAAAPLSQAQFTAKNKWWIAFYEAALPAVAAYLVRSMSPNVARGLYQSSVVNLGIAAVRGTQMGQRAGLNAFLPRQRGMQTYIPGVPPQLSGPATAFINNGAPVPNGMNAVVNNRWANATMAGSADPFKKN